MSLISYLLRRMLYTLPLLVAAITIIFILIRAAPGDPVQYLLGEAGASQEVIDRLRASMGLDKPLPVQFVIYVGKVLTGDLGTSVISGAPVLNLIMERFPATLLLMATQYTLAAIIGITFGVISARRPNSTVDNVITVFSLASFARAGVLAGPDADPDLRLSAELVPGAGHGQPADGLYRLRPCARRGLSPCSAGHDADDLQHRPCPAADPAQA